MSPLSPLGQNVPLPYERIWNPLIQWCLVPSLFEIGLMVYLEKKKFESRQWIIITSLLFLHRKKAWPLIYINLNFLKPKNTLCNVWLKFWQWFWRCRFLKVVKVFSLCRYYLPIEKGRGVSSIRTFINPYSKAILSQVC